MFKVGDRVRVLTSDAPYAFNKIGTVIEVSDSSFMYPVKVEMDDSEVNWTIYREKELELVVNGVDRMIECLK